MDGWLDGNKKKIQIIIGLGMMGGGIYGSGSPFLAGLEDQSRAGRAGPIRLSRGNEQVPGSLPSHARGPLASRIFFFVFVFLLCVYILVLYQMLCFIWQGRNIGNINSVVHDF